MYDARAFARSLFAMLLTVCFLAPPALAEAQSAAAPSSRGALAAAERCECHWWARDDVETPCPPKSNYCFKFIGSSYTKVCARRQGVCRPAGTQE